jgi:virulence-associated protein VapD
MSEPTPASEPLVTEPQADIEMEPDARPQRIRRIPARYIINHSHDLDSGISDEGGEILLNLLRSESDEEIDIECDDQDFPSIAKAFIDAEVEYVNTLAEPIDDPTATDPKTIQEAKSSIYWTEWLAALYEELESLKAKGVYEEVDSVPTNRKPLDSKWVLRIKRNKDGNISRFKARLVVKGFTQIPGQDFTYTFAPVARWESIRTLLTLTALHDWELRQIDVKTAYLNGPLEEEIYMRKPQIIGSGFWRLRRGLYGLRQSGRQWYFDLNAKLETIGFKRTESDWSVHLRTIGNAKSISATSVDDILIASNSKDESNAAVRDIAKLYEITDNSNVNFHLGCTIERWRQNRTIKLHQQSYVISILREFGMEACNPVSTPMQPNVHLTTDMCPKTDKEKEDSKSLPYCAIVGKCMYLATCTRPDIAYTVRELARFMSNYGQSHYNAAKHLLRYLRGTQSYGIFLGQLDNPYPLFRAMSDSDWGMGENRKSISGFVILLGDSPLSWSSKQQTVVALSSCEAEYLATTHCSKDVLWFRNLFLELGYPQSSATPLFCDNQGTVACTHDPHGHTKMKHIAIREHFIRDCVNNRLIDVIHIPNYSNIADLFTKPLHRVLHGRWVKFLRLDSGQGGVSEVTAPSDT